jgi:methyl-accepting chemotaxis protein
MHLTIRKKLYGLGFLGLLFTVAVGITGVRGISQVAGGIDDVSRTSSAIRNHIEASIFLDLSRADVSKILTTTEDAQDTAVSELESHLKLLSGRLATTNSLAQDTETRTALDQEIKLSDQYVQTASEISDLRTKPAEAGPLLGPFLQGYQDLRNMMDTTNDTLESGSKRAQAQAVAVVGHSRRSIILFCVASSVLLFGIAFTTARQITRRLASVIGNLKQLAAGDLTKQVKDSGQDELGEMAHWLNDAMAKFQITIARVASSAENVTAAVEGLNSVSQQMTANSEETTSRANIVTTSTEQVSSTLQTVATATEDMNSSIQEIAKNINQAAMIAGQAMQIADSTNITVSKLGDSSTEIGAVIKVITSIAQQTNLLALNATIEAARAGEAGKGFAVVANEVKELAKQTAKATEDISHKIQAIQLNTAESVQAIAKISETIIKINDISRTISVGIDEQNSTTNEIARNISEGARGSSEITNNISGVAQAAQSTSAEARNVQTATNDLRDMSSKLKELVSQFKYLTVGAAA